MTVAGIDATSEVARTNEQVPLKAAAVSAGAVVVLALVPVLLGLWYLAVPILLVGGILVWQAPTYGDKRVLADLGARPVGEQEAPRCHNVLDGLCISQGVRRPALFVVDDPACNAVAVGRSPSEAGIVVTSGLLEAGSAIALEGILAHELVRLERREPVATAASAWFPLARRWSAPDDVLLVDHLAVGLTRYPPGLVAGLELVRDAGSTVARPGRATADSWFAARANEVAADDGPAVSIDDRIAALREL